MDVSIIIINYNTKHLTSACIDSIFKNTTNIKFEVILVDNASKDGSKEFFSSDSRISYVYNNKNLGFGKANNLGLKYATGRNIFFLNSDTYLVNNAIKILSDILDKSNNIGVCGGNLFYDDMSPNISYEQHFPSIYWEINLLFHFIPNKIIKKDNDFFNNTSSIKDVAYICGADMMVKKNILDSLGAFDPDFFLYFEETELCYRILSNNYRIVSVPDAKIVHLCGKSSKIGNLSKPSKFYFESKRLYIKKTTPNKIKCFLYLMVAELNLIIHRLLGKW